MQIIKVIDELKRIKQIQLEGKVDLSSVPHLYGWLVHSNSKIKIIYNNKLFSFGKYFKILLFETNYFVLFVRINSPSSISFSATHLACFKSLKSRSVDASLELRIVLIKSFSHFKFCLAICFNLKYLALNSIQSENSKLNGRRFNF